MARYERFIFLVDKNERAMIEALAARLRRSQSDAVRFVVVEAARELEAQSKTMTDRNTAIIAEQATNATQAQSNKTTVTSTNQSGGITAQNIIVHGNFHQNAPAEYSPQKKNALEMVLKIIIGSVGFLAALVTILAYFKIFPF